MLNTIEARVFKILLNWQGMILRRTNRPRIRILLSQKTFHRQV
jgi:hypothetical protein